MAGMAKERRNFCKAVFDCRFVQTNSDGDLGLHKSTALRDMAR